MRIPREGSFYVRCWSAQLRPGEAEGLVSKLRRNRLEVIIQVFRSNRPPNATAVAMIAFQTLSAAKSGSTLAERPELDLLLRLGGTRQIGEAFERLGYKSKGKRLYLVAATGDGGEALNQLARQLSADRRFKELVKRRLTEKDFELIERAALLGARL